MEDDNRDGIVDILGDMVFGDKADNVYRGETINIVSPDSFSPDNYSILDFDLQGTFIEPSQFNQILDVAEGHGLIWLVGPSGVGKRTAINYILSRVYGRPKYSFPRYVELSKLANIENAYIVFPDFLGTWSLERENADADLDQIVRLSKSNTVIVTSPDDVFDRFKNELPKYTSPIEIDFKLIELSTRSYRRTEKVKLFNSLLDQRHNAGFLDDDQYYLGTQLLNKSRPQDLYSPQVVSEFERLISKAWLPGDIYQFVCDSLTRVSKSGEIGEALKASANFDYRVHRWFITSIEEVRIFILTLCIFNQLPAEELWFRYTRIAKSIRQHNPSVGIFPLGIIRIKAMPYVTETGSIEFVDARTHRAMLNEISINYREFFLELIPILESWTSESSVKSPAGVEIKRVRISIAKVVGVIASKGLWKISDLLNRWASDNSIQVRNLAGIAIREMVKQSSGENSALHIIDIWINKGKTYQRWSAGSALWRIATIKSREHFVKHAVRRILILLTDRDQYVIGSGAYAMHMIAKSSNIAFLGEVSQEIWPSLVCSEEAHIKTHASAALSLICFKIPSLGIEILDEWLTTTNKNLKFEGLIFVMNHPKLELQYQKQKLNEILNEDPEALIVHLNTTLDDTGSIEHYLSMLESLLSGEDNEGRRERFKEILAAMLADPSNSMSQLMTKLKDNGSSFWTEMYKEIENKKKNLIIRNQRDALWEKYKVPLFVGLSIFAVIFVCAILVGLIYLFTQLS